MKILEKYGYFRISIIIFDNHVKVVVGKKCPELIKPIEQISKVNLQGGGT